MKYICIDIETTGLDPVNNQIIEFCALINPGNYFHCYVYHERYVCNAYAAALNVEIFKKLSKRDSDYKYYSPCQMMFEFKNWLNIQNLLETKINFAGRNIGSFDIQFLNKIPGWNEIRHAHRYLDIGNLYVQPSDDIIPDLQECLNRADFTMNIKHTAYDDALAVWNLMKYKGF